MASTDLIVRLIGQTDGLRRDLARAQGSLKSFQSSVTRVGAALGVTFGATAIIQGIRTGISIIADFEDQMAKVGAVSRATTKELELLTKNAREIGQVSRYTATEIGGMQENLARLGFTTQQIIASTDAIRKLATATGNELAPSAETMAKTLNAFNLEARESERVANIMAESFSMTALNLEEFSVAMSYAGVSGKAFGLSVEEVTAMIGALVDAGLQGSKAGTGLRDIFLDLAKQGLTLQEAFDKVNSAARKDVAALDLVGKTSANALIILAENTDKVNELTAAFQDNETALDDMANKMDDTLAGSWARFKSAIEELVLEGSVFNKWLRGTVDALAEFAKGNFTLAQSLEAVKKQVQAETEAAKKMSAIQQTVNAAFASGNIEAYIRALDTNIYKEEIIAEIRARQKQEFKQQQEEKLKLMAAEVEKLEILRSQYMALSKAGELQGITDFDTSFSFDAIDNARMSMDSMLASIRGVKIELMQLPHIFQNGVGFINAMGDSFLNLKAIASEFATTMITSFAEDLGAALAGVGNFGESIINGMANFMKSLGQQMIQLGVAKALLDKLKTNPAIPGGALIAAGAALIAASSLISSTFSAGVFSGGGSGGGASSGGNSVGSGVVGLGFESRNQAINLDLKAVLRGNDLVLAIDKTRTYNNNRG